LTCVFAQTPDASTRGVDGLAAGARLSLSARSDRRGPRVPSAAKNARSFAMQDRHSAATSSSCP